MSLSILTLSSTFFMSDFDLAIVDALATNLI